MTLFVCKENPADNKCAASPATTPGCPGYNECIANPGLCDTTQTPPGENDIYTLSLTAGTGGKVYKNPNKAKYAEGETVQITAAPDDGYNFSGWTGGASGTASPLTVTMNGDKTITAVFTQKPTTPTNKFTVTLNQSTGGQIFKSPEKTEYDPGEQVTIRAEHYESYTFSRWTGDLTDSENPKTVTVTKNLVIGAMFTLSNPGGGGDGPFNLTINIVPAGGGIAIPEPTLPEDGEGPIWGPYAAGTNVTISYAENSGYEFTGWAGAGSGRVTRTVMMNADQTVTANFEQTGPGGGDTKYTLNLDITTNAAKNSGKCSVTQPKGGLGQYEYDPGTSITVTASGSAPYVFQGWRERNAQTDVSSSLSYTFTISKDMDLIARFIDTTTAQVNPYCRWENNPSNCWEINPGSTDPDVTKSEAECKTKTGEVVALCSDPTNGVFCDYPVSKDGGGCYFVLKESAAASIAACTADKGTVKGTAYGSCPAN
jgi:uncharacterized repeat protein (TIGR02543 family)